MPKPNNTKYKGRKPSYLPVCDGVCDGYFHGRCAKCTRAVKQNGSKQGRGPSIYSEKQPTLGEQVRLNPHLEWTDNQLREAGLL